MKDISILRMYKQNLIQYLDLGEIEVVIEDTIKRGRSFKNGFHNETLPMSELKRNRIRQELALIESRIITHDITALKNKLDNVSALDY